MKTDLEKFIELYKSLGIELQPIINTHNDFGYQYLELKVTEESRKIGIIGYLDFVTHIYFDKEGNFISQGIWE